MGAPFSSMVGLCLCVYVFVFVGGELTAGRWADGCLNVLVGGWFFSWLVGVGAHALTIAYRDGF